MSKKGKPKKAIRTASRPEFKIAWRDDQGQTSRVKTIDHKSFEGFISFLNRTIAKHKKSKSKDKKDAAWFLRGDATKRNTESVMNSQLVIGDVDDTRVSPEACSKTLAEQNITHFIYTTSSHKENNPRYRIVCPYYTENQDDCKRATHYLQHLIKGIDIASESYTWAQEWYLPIDGSETHGHIGKFEIPKSFEPVEENKKSKDEDNSGEGDQENNYEFHLEKLREGIEIHPHARGMCLALANVGMPEKFIVSTVWGHVEAQLKVRGIDDPSVRYESLKELARTAVEKVNKEKEDEDEVEIFQVDDKQPEKMELDWPPGLMGELAKSVFNFQRYQDMTIAIMTAFALVAGIAGRRHNINDMGLAIYVTLLADTGRGKDSIAKFITRTLSTCNPMNYLKFLGYKSFTGPKALMNMLKENPCRVSVITEAGFAIRMKSGEQEGLRGAVLDIYTKTGRHDVAVGSGYSDTNKSIPSVRATNFTMINESTPKMFIEAMIGREGATAGDYGRMFVYRITGDKPYENFQAEYELPKILKERISELMKFHLEKGTQDDPEPRTINKPNDYQKFSKHCTDMENKFRSTDPMKSALYSRANEKRLRLIGLMCETGIGVGPG